MATIRRVTSEPPVRESKHSDVEAIVRTGEANGEKFIQIDTYGSAERQLAGKVSQSIRLTKEVFEFIKQAGDRHF
jgi:hypothetical protein